MVKGKTRYDIETVRVKPWELFELWRDGWVIRSESIKMSPPETVQKDDELKAMWERQTRAFDVHNSEELEVVPALHG